MARYKVYVQNDHSIKVNDGVGAEMLVHQARMRAWARIGTELPARQMIVDTGSSVSLFTRAAWDRFRSQIQWALFSPLDFPGHGDVPALSRLPRESLLGGQFPYRLGWITVSITDLEPGTTGSAPIRILGKFLEDDRLPIYLVLGLRDGVLQHLRLVTEPAATETGIQAWLEEP